MPVVPGERGFVFLVPKTNPIYRPQNIKPTEKGPAGPKKRWWVDRGRKGRKAQIT